MSTEWIFRIQLNIKRDLFGKVCQTKLQVIGTEADVQKDNKLWHHLSAKRVSPSSRHTQTQQLTGEREEESTPLQLKTQNKFIHYNDYEHFLALFLQGVWNFLKREPHILHINKKHVCNQGHVVSTVQWSATGSTWSTRSACTPYFPPKPLEVSVWEQCLDNLLW